MTLPQAKEVLTKSIYKRLRKAGIISRHILFLAEYMSNGMNGSEAYIKHIARKNASEASRKSCGVHASAILAKPEILEAIKEIFDIWLAEKKVKLEKEIIAVQYARAFYDPTMFVDADGQARIKDVNKIPEKWRPAIDGIEAKYYGKDADRKVVVFKLADRTKALQELSKYIQLYQDSLGLKVDMGEDTIGKLQEIFNDKK